MKKKRQNRRISIILITAILLWNTFPVIGMASFITPGQAINPGEAITPGQSITPGDPISGGEFIAPGEVYDYGEAYNDGSSLEAGDSLNSGEPIVEGSPGSGGQFIAPNAPPSFSTIVGGDGDAIQAGEGVQAGNQVDAGNAGSGGSAVESGSGSNTGQTGSNGSAVDGGNSDGSGSAVESGNAGSNGSNVEAGQGGNAGNVDANGNPVDGGTGDANGNAVDGGNGDGSGSGIDGGDSLLGGDSVNGNATEGNATNGNGIDGGNGTNGNATNGNATDGNATNGNATNGNSTDAGESPSLWNMIFSSTKDSDSFIDTVSNIAGDVKTYALGFADDVAQGLIATHAGFRFNELASGNYSVYGKNNLNNSIGNWFYDRYRSYSYNGGNAAFGPGARHIGEARYNAFMQSKNIGGSGSLWSQVGNSTRSALNSSWNVASSSFWKPSNMLKLGGPVGVGLSSISSISEHSNGFSDFSGLASTDFAASLTTDVAIGVASTAVGSAASSAAAGALAGSVVPGIGTVIGAGVGLAAGFATTYLINGTETGRRIKSAVTNTVKKGYDAVVDGAKAVKDGIASGLSKIGSLFGG